MTQPRLPDGFRRPGRPARAGARRGLGPARRLTDPAAAAGARRPDMLDRRPARRCTTTVSAQLARTLLDATVAHPRPAGGPSHRDVTVVIPGAGQRYLVLRRLVSSLRGMRVIVVDDGSVTPCEPEDFDGAHCDVEVLRHPRSKGPAAARNTGLAACTHRLRRLPRLRRGAAPGLAGGAARALLRSHRRRWSRRASSACAERECGGPLRGGALVARPRPARGAGVAVRHGVLRAQRGDHLPPLGASGTSAGSTRPCIPARTSTCAGGSSKRAPGCATSPSRWSPTTTAPKCGIGSRARHSTAAPPRRCRSATRTRRRRW